MFQTVHVKFTILLGLFPLLDLVLIGACFSIFSVRTSRKESMEKSTSYFPLPVRIGYLILKVFFIEMLKTTTRGIAFFINF